MPKENEPHSIRPEEQQRIREIVEEIFTEVDEVNRRRKNRIKMQLISIKELRLHTEKNLLEVVLDSQLIFELPQEQLFWFAAKLNEAANKLGVICLTEMRVDGAPKIFMKGPQFTLQTP